MKLSNFKEWLQSKVESGCIYLWGGQGESLATLTDQYIRRKETTETNAQRVIALRNKRQDKYPNLRAYDCSGLIIAYLNEVGDYAGDLTAHGIAHKGKYLSKLTNGCFVTQLNGSDHVVHIGVYFDGYVYHAKGRDFGVVKEKFNQYSWDEYFSNAWVEDNGKEKYIFWRNMKNKGSQLMEGDDIFQLQTLLKANRYNLTVDSIFGNKTEKAVKQFQKKNGLATDGIAGENTVFALGCDFNENLHMCENRMIKLTSPLTTGPDVKLIQEFFTEDGEKLAIDGEYGKATQTVIKNFQKKSNISADGIVGPVTWEKLAEAGLDG